MNKTLNKDNFVMFPNEVIQCSRLGMRQMLIQRKRKFGFSLVTCDRTFLTSTFIYLKVWQQLKHRMEVFVESRAEQAIVPKQRKNHHLSTTENLPIVLNHMVFSLMRSSAISIMPASEFYSPPYTNSKKIIQKTVYLHLFYKNNKFKTLIVSSDGVITEKLCPDGMVFNDYSIDQEKCDLPFNIDCSKRSKLREYLFSCTHGQSVICFENKWEISLDGTIK